MATNQQQSKDAATAAAILPVAKSDATQQLTMPPKFIVAMAASAGGLSAIQVFFDNMPADSGLAFVVIQHLSPDHKSLMPALLKPHTAMPVVLVEHEVTIEANSIYLFPPQKDMVVELDRLIVLERDRQKLHALPIDRFLSSLAMAWGRQTMAVILSGAGTDGSGGIVDIHEKGGLVLAQSPDSAEFDGMPVSAIATRCVDYVLVPEQMAAVILAYLANPAMVVDYEQQAQTEGAAAGMPVILKCLKDAYEIDFEYYRPGTIARRIERRVLMQPQPMDLAQYAQKLKTDPQELSLLYNDLLIGVTRFFRDPDAFDVLEQRIIPGLLDRLTDNEELRVWVCGCSTGEEAYSIAILIAEAFAARQQEPRVKILATDLDQESLQIAAAGYYSEPCLAHVPTDWRRRYFVQQANGKFRVHSQLRKLLLFSEHNVLRDPPFTKLDLVSCRNLLIYLQPTVQRQVIASFHYALKIAGNLMLGTSEGLGDLVPEFEVLDRRWKLFVKLRDNRSLTALRHPLGAFHAYAPRIPNLMKGDLALTRAYDSLLDTFIPAGVLVNQHHEAVHVFGNATRYLNAPNGRVNNDVLNMLDGHLRIACMLVLRQAQQKKIPTSVRGVQFRDSAGTVALDVEAIPIIDDQHVAQHFMLVMKECAAVASLGDFHTQPTQIDYSSSSHVLNLEAELLRLKETLQFTLEEQESNSEELQANNEELLAANEELQSTNEELNSVNEELHIVNAEHAAKILELNQVTNDLNNLIRSTELATIFIDSEWIIRLFSPKATEIFPLLPQDIGRSIRHITPNDPDPQFKQDLQQVFSNGKSVECLLEWSDNRAFLRRVTPYQDENNKQSGLVITYVDVSSQCQIERALRETEARWRFALEATSMGAWSLSLQDLTAWRSLQHDQIFGYSELLPEWTFEKFLEHVLPEDRATVSEKFQLAVAQQQDWNFQCRIRRADGEVRWIWTQGAHFDNQQGQFDKMFGLVQDITDQKNIELALKQAKEVAESANRAKSSFLANISHELRTPLNAILGFSDILMVDSALAAEQHEEVAIINRSGSHLLTLINDILEVAKIESGRIQLEHKPFDLHGLIHEVIEMMQLRAKQKGLQLWLEQQFDVPHYVLGDLARLRQILINLLGNAIKFTQQGQVLLRVGLENDTERPLRFEVEDTGGGIEQSQQQRIFEPFVQLGDSTLNQGTGLGLTITREFVRLMEGQISLDSQPGRGSVFRVCLPLSTVDETPGIGSSLKNPRQVVAMEADQTEFRILIAEDQLENQLLLAKLLAKLGISYRIAEQGAKVVELFQQWQPHLILMDRRMPVMDGIMATRAIRQLEGGQQVKIVAITASALKEQREEVLAAGMDDLISKPYRVNEIYDCLSRQLGIRFIYAAEDHGAAQKNDLSAEMLQPLPVELRRELKQALERLQEQKIASILNQITEFDPALGAILSDLVAYYDYRAILNVLPDC